MLPTPSTSHVPFDTIYEPSEDSYLFLDTLSSASESAWLSHRFSPPSSSTSPSATPSPLLVEVGTGSGVVLAFAAANSHLIFGRRDVLALGTDVNRNACLATRQTVETAVSERQVENGKDTGNVNGNANGDQSARTVFLSAQTADLASSLRENTVDVLLFNPPYVPTEELPTLPTPAPSGTNGNGDSGKPMSKTEKFEEDSYFLSLTYAGGEDGMQITNKLLEAIPRILDPVRGVAYVLLCRQNRPDEVMQRIREWGDGWTAEVVGDSGGKAGWEKLVIVRIWRPGL